MSVCHMLRLWCLSLVKMKLSKKAGQFCLKELSLYVIIYVSTPESNGNFESLFPKLINIDGANEREISNQLRLPEWMKNCFRKNYGCADLKINRLCVCVYMRKRDRGRVIIKNHQMPQHCALRIEREREASTENEFFYYYFLHISLSFVRWRARDEEKNY